MFGKKFFSTVTLSGAAVSLIGNVGSVYCSTPECDLLKGTQYAVDYFCLSKSEFESFRTSMELALKAIPENLKDVRFCINPVGVSLFKDNEDLFNFFSFNYLNAVVNGSCVKFLKVVGSDVLALTSSIDEVRELLKVLKNKAFVDCIKFSK